MMTTSAAAVDLADLRLFRVLGEELHFGRAAARLHLSQPGLSYRLKRLEDSLGYALLARNRRSVSLTAAGASLLEGSVRLLGDADRLVADAGRVARGEEATLRVAFVGTALYSVLPSLVRRLAADHPGVRLLVEEAKTTTQVRALSTGALDLGIAHLPVDHPGLESTVLLDDRVGLALPADHRLADSPVLRLADLATDPFVLFPRDLEPATHDAYVGACVDAGFAPRVAAQATGLPTILALVASGVGCAFVAESVAANSTRAGVAFRPLSGPAPTLRTGPVWRSGDTTAGLDLVRGLLTPALMTAASIPELAALSS